MGHKATTHDAFNGLMLAIVQAADHPDRSRQRHVARPTRSGTGDQPARDVRRHLEHAVDDHLRPVTTTGLKLDMTSAAPYDPTTGNLAISELSIPGVT